MIADENSVKEMVESITDAHRDEALVIDMDAVLEDFATQLIQARAAASAQSQSAEHHLSPGAAIDHGHAAARGTNPLSASENVKPEQALPCASSADRSSRPDHGIGEQTGTNRATQAGGLALSSTRAIEGVRDEVARFAAAMERKLKANDHKAHWSGCSRNYLLRRLRMEVNELGRVAYNKDANVQAICDEAADVANFAMMIADNLKALPVGTPSAIAACDHYQPTAISDWCQRCGCTRAAHGR